MARYERDVREIVYRAYVTDALQGIPQMKYNVNRWVDTLKSDEERDTRTAEEVVDDVIAALSGGG